MRGRGLAPVVLVAVFGGCGRKLPDAVKQAVETNRPLAVKVAEDAAKLCPGMKAAAPFQKDPSSAPPPPPSPATGTALATDAQVVDVYITCSWPDPRDSSGSTWAGTSFPRLKGTTAVPVRAVTMPEDMVETSCKAGVHDCMQIISPSRHHADEASADIRVLRPTPDGGEVEVVVALQPK
jgi:hypothetical protein